MSESQRISEVLSMCKKKLPWMIVLLIIGILLMTAGNFVKSDNQEKEDNTETDVVEQEKNKSTVRGSEHTLENRLEKILAQMQGVGNVSVTVVLESGPEFQYARDRNTNERNIKENDTNGGERVTTETRNDSDLVLVQSTNMGGQEPVLIQEQKPQIEGVLIVAEGAVDPTIKAELSRAVQTVLGLPAHTISVWPMKNEG